MSIEQENNEMLRNQIREISHHSNEIKGIVNKRTRVEPWVVAKTERAATDLSDVTHYLDGERYSDGGSVKKSAAQIILTDKDLGLYSIYDLEHNEYSDEGFTSALQAINYARMGGYEVVNISDFANLYDKGSMYADGGGVSFTDYKGESIMFEPHFNEYYVGDAGPFSTMDEAKAHIDSGSPMSDSMRGAYEHGLFAEGGEVNTVKILKDSFQQRADQPNRVYHSVEGMYGNYWFTAKTDNSYKSGYGSNGINGGCVYQLDVWRDGNPIGRDSSTKGGHISEDFLAGYDNKWDNRPRTKEAKEVVSVIVEWLEKNMCDLKREWSSVKFAEGGAVDKEIFNSIEQKFGKHFNYQKISTNKGDNKIDAILYSKFPKGFGEDDNVYSSDALDNFLSDLTEKEKSKISISIDDETPVSVDEVSYPFGNFEISILTNSNYADGGGLEATELKGYRVNIFKSSYGTSSNIVSDHLDSAILVTDGKSGDSSTVMSDEPYLKLVKRNIFGKIVLSAEPVNFGHETRHKMFGGTFIWSTDSRFRENVSEQPIALHDRVEFADGGLMYADGGMVRKYLSDFADDESLGKTELHKDANDIMDWSYSQKWSDDDGTLKRMYIDKIRDFERKHNVRVESVHSDDMFADGGGVSSENAEKIAKLEKVLSSTLVPDSVKEKARMEIERLKGERLKSSSAPLTNIQIEAIKSIANRTGLRQEAISSFISKNNLDEKETVSLITGLGRGQILAQDIVTAIVGTPNNKYEKKVIAFVKSGEAFKSEATASDSGLSAEQRDLNKKAIAIVDKAKITNFEALVSEALTDANYHSSAFKFAQLVDSSIKTKEDWYKAEDFEGDEKTRDAGIQIANMCGWDGDKITEALYFVLKMKGEHRLADALTESFKIEKEKYLAQETIDNTDLSVFEELVRNSSSFQEAFDRVPTIKGIPLETARYFSDKYNPTGELSREETFRKFYNEIKGISEAQKSIRTAVEPETKPSIRTAVVEVEKEQPNVSDDRLKGKHISDVAKYVSHRDIESITFTIDGKSHTVKGSDIFDGIYVENNAVGVKAKRTTKAKQPKVIRTQFEEEEFEYGKGGYTRPNVKTTGVYEFAVKGGVYEVMVVGFERESETEDSLYFDDSNNTEKKELGSIIIKNSAWNKLSKGQSIMARSTTGIKGKLTRIKDLY